jgi:hypothetical protein
MSSAQVVPSRGEPDEHHDTTHDTTTVAAVSGRHTGTRSGVRRRFPVVLTFATLVGVWLGLDAPDTSPVAPPAPVVQQTAATSSAAPPATAPAGDGR